MVRRIFWAGLAAFFTLAIVGGVYWWRAASRAESAPSAMIVPGVKIGGPFSLTDHRARPVSDKTYRGKYLLVSFGFTTCPDVCPTGLTTVAGAMDALGKDAGKVQPLLITVDPERDTPQQLAGYVGQFHPQLIGLTGTAEQIKEAAAQYRVYYARQKPREDGFYLVDHSAFLYLVGPDGTGIGVFRHTAPPEDIAAAIRLQFRKVAQG